jgi:hypothetical protein
MKYHGIQYNSLGAVDSLNTQHCVLLKHSINSATHTESIKCLRSTQYAIASVSNPFASMTLESNPLRPRQFVSQSPIHSHPRLSSKSLSLVFLPLMMFKGGKKLVSSTEQNTEGGLYHTNLVLSLLLVAGSQNCFFFKIIVISALQCTNGADFSLLVKLHKYICHFCSNDVNLHSFA